LLLFLALTSGCTAFMLALRIDDFGDQTSRPLDTSGDGITMNESTGECG
jgi:hypothetical protein